MDALLMEGTERASASVMCLRDIKNPIQVAYSMIKHHKSSLCGEEASCFAVQKGFEKVDQTELVTEEAVAEWQRLMQFKTTIDDVFRGRTDDSEPSDTVGCVAMDRYGNIACGTSTGGITAKLAGRVGDVPLVGSGGFCDSSVGGVSTTGHGEAINRVCLAYRIIENMRAGMTSQDAALQAIRFMDDRIEGGHGGAICINKAGDIGMYFNTPRMVWASMKAGELSFGINSEDHPYTAATSALIVKRLPELQATKRTIHLILSSVAVQLLEHSFIEHLTTTTIDCEIPVVKQSAAIATHLEYALKQKLNSACSWSAVVMDGSGLHGASVGHISTAIPAVRLAEYVRTETDHTMVVGTGAEHLARQRLPPLDIQDESVHCEHTSGDISAAVVVSEHNEMACSVFECIWPLEPNHCYIGSRMYADNKLGVAVVMGNVKNAPLAVQVVNGIGNFLLLKLTHQLPVVFSHGSNLVLETGVFPNASVSCGSNSLSSTKNVFHIDAQGTVRQTLDSTVFALFSF